MNLIKLSMLIAVIIFSGTTAFAQAVKTKPEKCKHFKVKNSLVKEVNTGDWTYYESGSIRVYMQPETATEYGSLFKNGQLSGKMLYSLFNFSNCYHYPSGQDSIKIKDKEEYHYKGKYVILQNFKRTGPDKYTFNASECFWNNNGVNRFDLTIGPKKVEICYLYSEL